MSHFSDKDDRDLRREIINLLNSLDHIEEIASDMMDSELYAHIRNMYDFIHKFSCRMEVLQGTKEWVNIL